MTQDFDEPSSLAARLLDVEPPDADRMQKLHKEINAMFTQELTPSRRIAWTGTLVVSLGFAASSAARWHAHDASGGGSAWPILALLMLVNAAYAGWVLARGSVDLRHSANLQRVGVALTLLAALALTIAALNNPTLGAIAWAMLGLLWFVLSLAVMLYNRIVAAELNTRESLLRLELRLLDGSKAK